MFGSLSDKLTGILDKLKKRGALSEDDVKGAMREVRIALLEADVALPVAKSFIQEVTAKAMGQEVLKSITPGQMVVKIVHDELMNLLGVEPESLKLSAIPSVVMMVGLQGSGKTTFTGKLARQLKNTTKKKILLASVDVYRPAAREQLQVLADQVGVDCLPIESNDPISITKAALKKAKSEGYEVLLLDTAGRLHIDEALMNEVAEVHKIANPTETLFVADSMLGQDAYTVATSFNEKIPLTGSVLTRVDGDARGGAALSIRYVTGCPIKFLGVGEKLEDLEVFNASRIADRILGMGDVVGLVEKAAEAISKEDAEEMAAKMKKGDFDLADMEKQLLSMLKMGGMGGLMKMIPGVQKLQQQLKDMPIDDKAIHHQIAIIRSMTPKEKRYPNLLNAKRKIRVANGAGVEVQSVNKLLKQFKDMQTMMKRVRKMGMGGMLKSMFKGGFN